MLAEVDGVYVPSLVNVEFASDVSRYYPNAKTEQLMNEVIKLGKNVADVDKLNQLIQNILAKIKHQKINYIQYVKNVGVLKNDY